MVEFGQRLQIALVNLLSMYPPPCRYVVTMFHVDLVLLTT